MLAVAAVDKTGSPAYFSSDNLSVQVAAPGVRVLAQGNNGQYWLVNGTSPACALAATVAALIKAVHPRMSPALVVRAIEASAQHPPGGYNDRVGFGTVDAAAALTRRQAVSSNTCRTGAASPRVLISAGAAQQRSRRPRSAPAALRSLLLSLPARRGLPRLRRGHGPPARPGPGAASRTGRASAGDGAISRQPAVHHRAAHHRAVRRRGRRDRASPGHAGRGWASEPGPDKPGRRPPSMTGRGQAGPRPRGPRRGNRAGGDRARGDRDGRNRDGRNPDGQNRDGQDQ